MILKGQLTGNFIANINNSSDTEKRGKRSHRFLSFIGKKTIFFFNGKSREDST